MAESADILSHRGQVTILPDLNAGCSMADMAEITQVEDCWERLVAAGLTSDLGDGVTPITYMDSTAAIKAFCGERGGVVAHLRTLEPRSIGHSRRIPRFSFFPISISVEYRLLHGNPAQQMSY